MIVVERGKHRMVLECEYGVYIWTCCDIHIGYYHSLVECLNGARHHLQTAAP